MNLSFSFLLFKKNFFFIPKMHQKIEIIKMKQNKLYYYILNSYFHFLFFCLHRTAAFIVTSSIYGQLLVVVCIALFTAKIVAPVLPLWYFEVCRSFIVFFSFDKNYSSHTLTHTQTKH